ncbi:MAG: hypothetical protein U0Z70_09385 [Thermomicrobiales bacterium]
MSERERNLHDPSDTPTDELDRPLTTAADVESAGRSCVVIIAMAILIVVLLGIWIVYTTS